jgi:hypothetical protein
MMEIDEGLGGASHAECLRAGVNLIAFVSPIAAMFLVSFLPFWPERGEEQANQNSQ